MRYKTQLFRILPREINTILYVDADVEIHAPLRKLEMDVLQKGSKKCAAIYSTERLLVQLEPRVRFKYCSGIAIYFRDQSKTLMEEWNKMILSMNYEKDQPALRQAISNTKANICSIPSRHVHYSPDYMFSKIVYWFSRLIFNRKENTFVHHTSAKSMDRLRTPYKPITTAPV